MSSLMVLAIGGAGLLMGPALRREAFARSVSFGAPRRTACPRCEAQVVNKGSGWRGHVALLNGRCNECGLRFGPPPASVELAAAAAFAALAVGAHEALPLLAYCWMAGIGIVLSIVDMAVHRLPDGLTAASAAGVLALLGAQALVSHAGDRLLGAMASAIGAAVFYLLMWALTSGSVGLGDAKLAVGLGLAVGWSGWTAVFAAVTLGLVLTGIAAVVLLTLKHVGRKDSIPHGPFMVLGSIAVLVLAQV